MSDITGRIAAILGNNEVVINRGKSHGVVVGMTFGIKLPIPEIIDPDDSTNVLSGLFYTKAKIRIESVTEKMSFASVLPKRTYHSSTADIFSNLTVRETVEYPTISGSKLISDNDWKIRVGDEVYFIPPEKESTKK
jgi:hypothetical protein